MAVALIMCLAAVSWAAPEEKVSVRSNSLQLQEKQGDISFEGDVEVRMSQIVLNCDLLTVRSAAGDPSRILSGKASGNVVLTRGSDTVKASTAVFDLEKGQVILSGVPRFTREETTIEAQEIVYSIDDGTASFTGPVKAVFETAGD